MMGRQHFLSGVAVWLAAAPTLNAAYGLDTSQLVLGAAVTAGAAMVPDLDQHGSSIGRVYGPVTNVLARAVGAVGGGHRNGSHSLLGVAAFTGAAGAAVAVGGWPEAIVVWIVLGVALRTAGLTVPGPRWLQPVTYAVGMAAVVVALLDTGVDLGVPLVAGMLLGTVVHIVGDMLTPEGCPLLWPLSRHRSGIGLVTTGSRWSSPLVTGCLTVLVGVLLYGAVT